MKPRNEFIDYLAEVLHSFGAIEARRMFGGHGIYHGGLIFGLVIGDVLYLKSDAQSQPEFTAAGSTPFQFEKGGKTVATSYFTAPANVFEDADEARRWASLAYDAALRADRKKVAPAKSKSTKKPAAK